MCGVAGVYDRSGEPVSEEFLHRLIAPLRHRGPDDTGVHITDHVGLGNQRLAILDIESGHQPFVSDGGDVVVVHNGEIYNFVELAAECKTRGNPCATHCDTEVLLRLYQLEGLRFLSKLNGMFASAIYDRAKDELYLIRDRLGIKPLYIVERGPSIWFSSEIKSFLKAELPPRLDSVALVDFLLHNYTPPPRTMFEGVTHVLPGHVVTIDRSGIRSETWWTCPSTTQTSKMTRSDWHTQFLELLEDAVRLRLRSDVPVGAFLSGGVDSSSVVGMMHRLRGPRMKTFSIGFEDRRFDETRWSELAAERFQTEHYSELFEPSEISQWIRAIYHCDQPHGDVSFIPTLRLSALASSEVKVVLTGDGGDELFGGYDKYVHFLGRERDSSTLVEDFVRETAVFEIEQMRLLLVPELRSVLTDHDPLTTARTAQAGAEALDPVNQLLYFDVVNLLPGNNLVKPDRMGMAHSLEARTPFLDYRLVEFAFTQTPGDWKVSGQVTKKELKEAVRGLIGDELTYRRKQMFTVPVGEWLKGSLTHLLDNFLLGADAATREIFEGSIVRRMVDDHRCGRRNLTRELRALLAVEIWMRMFLRGERVSEDMFSAHEPMSRHHDG